MEYGVTLTINPTPTVDSASALQNVSVRDAESFLRIYGGHMKSSSGVHITPKTAMGFPPLWRALNVISDDVAGLPCNVFRRNDGGVGRDVQVNHPGEELMRNVGTTCNFQRLMKTCTAHAMLYGNGFIAIDRDTRKRPVDATILDPNSMMIVYRDGKMWYLPLIDGEQVRIPEEDVVHIRGLCNDGKIGIDVIDLMKDALGVGIAAMQFGGRFFGQGSNAGGILMIPGSFSEEKIRNTMSAWDKMTQGLQRAHKVALLQDGAKFQQLTIENEKAQFLQTREFELRATIANIFGIPPHMLGDGTRTSHNSLEQEDQNYLTRALNPWLKEWERELGQKLLSSRERAQQSHFVEFNREALIQMSFQDKVMGIAKQLEVGVLNVNESRRLLNLPDIGSDGELRFRPANWVGLGDTMDTNSQQTQSDSSDSAPPQQQNDAQSRVLRAMVNSTVTKSLRIEKDRVVMAARDAQNMPASLDTFYSGWTERFFDSLGWKTPTAIAVMQEHVETSRKNIEALQAVTSTTNLESAVREVVACWDDRGELLTQKICEAI